MQQYGAFVLLAKIQRIRMPQGMCGTTQLAIFHVYCMSKTTDSQAGNKPYVQDLVEEQNQWVINFYHWFLSSSWIMHIFNAWKIHPNQLFLVIFVDGVFAMPFLS